MFFFIVYALREMFTKKSGKQPCQKSVLARRQSAVFPNEILLMILEYVSHARSHDTSITTFSSPSNSELAVRRAFSILTSSDASLEKISCSSATIPASQSHLLLFRVFFDPIVLTGYHARLNAVLSP